MADNMVVTLVEKTTQLLLRSLHRDLFKWVEFHLEDTFEMVICHYTREEILHIH